MEAVWTRYFPLSITVRDWIQKGKIGDVMRVISDLSVGFDVEEEWDVSNRMVNKDLAGGALLDLGIYALTWVFQTAYHTLPVAQRKAPKVVGATITPVPATGADETTMMLLEFPSGPPSAEKKTSALATASLRLSYDQASGTEHSVPAVRVYGTKGEIQVYGPIYRPSRIKLLTKNHYKDEKAEVEEKTFDFPGGGHGMFWEADEAARCWSDGKLESEGMTWEESTVIMEVMDEVRKQGGLTYPEEIETTDYPVNLKSKGK